MLWLAAGGFLAVWFVLTFLLHKSGFIHVLLLTAISLFVVQFAAYRKTRYQRLSSGR
jgi:hypothetical protein